jgi:hypothetical protein
MFKLLLFALFIFLTSCTTNVSDEDAFGMVDVDQNYTEKDIFFLELDALKDSEKMPEGYIVSFLKPKSGDSLDTVTVTTSSTDMLFIKEESFYYVGMKNSEGCMSYYVDLDLDEYDMASENRDTIFLNYGKYKLMDYIPYQEIPTINKSLLKKTFSVIDREKNHLSSDTIISSYTLEARNFLDGVEFEEYVEYLGDYSVKWDEPCQTIITLYPEPLKERKMYYLSKLEELSLPKDTTINWTLVYTDQYGRSDSLEIKTFFE